ncbi:MAG: cellulose synthase family protein [Bacteroidia bacterium]
MLNALIIGAYLFFLTFILLYSLAQLNLTFLYLKAKKQINSNPLPFNKWPLVTIQLPVYNEKYVVERLLNSIAKIDYDKTLLQIQVLDDSEDETVEIIANKVNELKRQGFNITQVIRPHRVDFKAGALQYGMGSATGEFIAIFDADFVPKPNFLKSTLPYFKNEKIGVVQTRWGHLNQGYSILTRLQSYVLNAHFTVDQTGRNFGNHFINFNGTAGVWRKQTIIQSGGWQGDTLTEDLDLSYRAQLKGWKFKYLENQVSPAELPAEMNALRSQQFRWAKGAAECTRKNLFKVLKAPTVNLKTKLNAVFHLLNSFNWVCLMASSFLLLPFSFIINAQPQLAPFLSFMVIYHVSFVALFFYYLMSNKFISFSKPKDYWQFIISYPVFIGLMMGLSIYNAVGVIEGYLGIKSSFVRTPKFNITNTKKSLKGFNYVKFKFNFITILELLSIAYFMVVSKYLFDFGYYNGLSFSVLMCLGLSAVFWYSISHSLKSKGS